MKIYKTQKEVNADIRDGVLEVDGDVQFEFNLVTKASLIILGNITAWGNITAQDISAGENITAVDITAKGNISAHDITAGGNISVQDISAGGDISFYAFAIAYRSLICKSIKGRRKNSKYFCLDGEVEIKG